MIPAPCGPLAVTGHTVRRSWLLLNLRSGGVFLVTRVDRPRALVHLLRMDAHGDPAPHARTVHVPADQLERRYERYRPCRWSLLCMGQADRAVAHRAGPIDACARCARPHREWLHGGRVGDEPDPMCWCPDGRAGSARVEHCPLHGTPRRRGTWLARPEPGAADVDV